mmetsp:Transcript_125441/g.354852  ORF Transcript_125441/g.354852 Transcript_125441/m.354852 type:complete len:301 (-) Transcript_125441:264-1166(-)
MHTRRLWFINVVLSQGALAASTWFPTRDDECIVPLEPPPARSAAEGEHRAAVGNALEHYWQAHSGYGITAADEAAIADAGADATPMEEPARQHNCRAATYGEVTFTGMRQIGRKIGCDAWHPDGKHVFVDLGSGVGKFVALAYLEWPSVARAVGVELSSARSARARAAWEDLTARGEVQMLRGTALELPGNFSRTPPTQPAADAVLFIQGDMFLQDVREATHVYVASLCFHDPMLDRLARKLAAEGTRLSFVATLRRFPHGMNGFDEVGHVTAEMSWTRGFGGGATVYVYRRRGAAPGGG